VGRNLVPDFWTADREKVRFPNWVCFHNNSCVCCRGKWLLASGIFALKFCDVYVICRILPDGCSIPGSSQQCCRPADDSTTAAAATGCTGSSTGGLGTTTAVRLAYTAADSCLADHRYTL